ncbi:MAG: hypothetical protein AAF335_03045 [Bacteroidota bacterium]
MEKKLLIILSTLLVCSNTYASQPSCPTMQEQLLARKKQMQSPTKREAKKNNLKPLQQNNKPTGRIITDEQRENKEIKELEKDLKDTQKESEKELNATPNISEEVDSDIDNVKLFLKQFRDQLKRENQKESCDPKTVKEIEDKIKKQEELMKFLTKKRETLQYQEEIDLSLPDKKNKKEDTSSLLIEDQLTQKNDRIKQDKGSIPRGAPSTTTSNTSVCTLDTLEKRRDKRLKKIKKGAKEVDQENKKIIEEILFDLRSRRNKQIMEEMDYEKEKEIYKKRIEKRDKIYKESIEKGRKEHEESIEKGRKEHEERIEKRDKIYKESIEKEWKEHEEYISSLEKNICPPRNENSMASTVLTGFSVIGAGVLGLVWSVKSLVTTPQNLPQQRKKKENTKKKLHSKASYQ